MLKCKHADVRYSSDPAQSKAKVLKNPLKPFFFCSFSASLFSLPSVLPVPTHAIPKIYRYISPSGYLFYVLFSRFTVV